MSEKELYEEIGLSSEADGSVKDKIADYMKEYADDVYKHEELKEEAPDLDEFTDALSDAIYKVLVEGGCCVHPPSPVTPVLAAALAVQAQHWLKIRVHTLACILSEQDEAPKDLSQALAVVSNVKEMLEKEMAGKE